MLQRQTYFQSVPSANRRAALPVFSCGSEGPPGCSRPLCAPELGSGVSRTGDLIEESPQGLWCAAGGFHIDPWCAVDRAVVTHAHSDHAAWGCADYLTAEEGVAVLRMRVGEHARIEGQPYLERRRIGDVLVSFHPAGHILGSSQVRLEHVSGGPVWVFTGDFATRPSRSARAFEPVECDVLLTESTFGLPIFRWPDESVVAADINRWWASNAAAGKSTIITAYALGKAQRVLGLLDPSIGPIGAHGAVMRFDRAFRDAGISLPPVAHASPESAGALKGAGIIVATPSALGTPWMRKFAGPEGIATAFASGWMAIRGRRRWRSLDRGFIVSDHADWDGLTEAILATGAHRIGVTHGYAEQMARYWRERGMDTFVIRTRFTTDDGVEAEPDAPEPPEECA